MRLRLVVLIALLAMVTPSYARAYEWPIKPFDQAHPVQGNFNDPRLSRRHFDEDPRNKRSFHSGIDIAAPSGTAVYAIYPGRVRLISRTALSIRTSQQLRFGYWHITPAVKSGEEVSRLQLLGWVAPRNGPHVHLSEWRDGDYVNPRRFGGIYPDTDTTPPAVRSLSFINQFSYQFGYELPAGYETMTWGRRGETPVIKGEVGVWATVFDISDLQPEPPWEDMRLSPAMVSWWIKTPDDRITVPRSTVVDFRYRLYRVPLIDVYAPGTLQNSPKWPGRYRIWLTRALDTRQIPDGIYIVVVEARDVAGNLMRRGFPVRIANASTDVASGG